MDSPTERQLAYIQTLRERMDATDLNADAQLNAKYRLGVGIDERHHLAIKRDGQTPWEYAEAETALVKQIWPDFCDFVRAQFAAPQTVAEASRLIQAVKSPDWDDMVERFWQSI